MTMWYNRSMEGVDFMANSSLIQVRASEEDKMRAAEILDNLGTNLSSVINMLLKQIIITESIPFEISMRHQTALTKEEMTREVDATMRLEGLLLDESDRTRLVDYANGKMTGDEARAQILKELGIGNE